MRKIDDILGSYLKYSDKANNFALMTQAGSTAIQAASAMTARDGLTYKPAEGVIPKAASFLFYDGRASSVRTLNDAFNTYVKSSREHGRPVNPDVISKFGDEYSKIDNAHNAAFMQNITRENALNTQMQSRADSVNAGIATNNSKMLYDLNNRKSGMLAGVGSLVGGGMNTLANINSRNEVNKLSAEYKFKVLDEMLKARKTGAVKSFAPFIFGQSLFNNQSYAPEFK